MAQRPRETAIFTAYEEDAPYDQSRPEKELLRAILQNALIDLKKPGELGRRAREYFLSPSDEYIFSFQSVCAYLNVSPRKVLLVAGLTGENTPKAEPEKAPNIDPVQEPTVEAPYRS